MPGESSKNLTRGTQGAISESGCGPFAATPIFLKIEKL